MYEAGEGAVGRERVLFLNLRNGVKRVLFLTGVFLIGGGGGVCGGLPKWAQ